MVGTSIEFTGVNPRNITGSLGAWHQETNSECHFRLQRPGPSSPRSGLVPREKPDKHMKSQRKHGNVTGKMLNKISSNPKSPQHFRNAPFHILKDRKTNIHQPPVDFHIRINPLELPLGGSFRFPKKWLPYLFGDIEMENPQFGCPDP